MKIVIAGMKSRRNRIVSIVENNTTSVSFKEAICAYIMKRVRITAKRVIWYTNYLLYHCILIYIHRNTTRKIQSKLYTDHKKGVNL